MLTKRKTQKQNNCNLSTVKNRTWLETGNHKTERISIWVKKVMKAIWGETEELKDGLCRSKRMEQDGVIII